MAKKAYLQMANEIEALLDNTSTDEFISLKLECGMRVRCENKPEAIRSMAAKFRKTNQFGTGGTTIRKHSCARPSPKQVAAIIKAFQEDKEYINAAEFQKLHEEPL